MKLQTRLPLSCALMLMLGACANRDPIADNDPYGTGPFDSQGNYREDWADDPGKWRKPSNRQKPVDDLPQIAVNERPPADATPLPPSRPTTSASRSAQTTVKPKPVAAKPKPRPVASKPKPKPQSSVVRYTVKKGDSLARIASRNKSSVAAIQKANGISGTLIRPGQVLRVPRVTKR